MIDNNAPILEMHDICKAFNGIQALQNVHFTLRRGEVNALLGENGAGKSTLIKIITGAYQRDGGVMRLFGEEVHFTGTIEASERGISAVYQELNLVRDLTVYENVFLGHKLTKGGFIKVLDKREMCLRTRMLLKELGAKIDENELISNLSVAQQQMVEIAKALAFDSKILIFDEPSATLTNREITELKNIIRDLKERGLGIIYISHRLEEVFEIGDTVTILRDGKFVRDIPVAQTNLVEIVRLMVGRDVNEKFPKKFFPIGEEILRVEHLSSRKHFQDVSFTLHRGEVLGIAGLVGAGRTEVAKCIFGALSRTGGEVFLYGKRLDIKSPTDAISSGISLLSEDRKEEGLIQLLNIEKNLIVVSQEQFKRAGIFRRTIIQEKCLTIAERLKLNTRNFKLPVDRLSGGNQQKVSLGKWLLGQCRLIILDEPTRGIDVGAKVEIYNFINELVETGIGVIMISSELSEILGMSDRIMVMCEGRKTGELKREYATQDLILKYATGQEVSRS